MPNARHRVLHRKLLSLIHFIRLILAVTAIINIAYGTYFQSLPHLYIAGGCLISLLIFLLVHSVESSKVACPSCRSQILQSKKFPKHKEAKKFLGSHALRVALQVIFTKSFRCQFCHKAYQWRGTKKAT